MLADSKHLLQLFALRAQKFMEAADWAIFLGIRGESGSVSCEIVASPDHWLVDAITPLLNDYFSLAETVGELQKQKAWLGFFAMDLSEGSEFPVRILYDHSLGNLDQLCTEVEEGRLLSECTST
jgi:hypothetical protein